jgi:iron complex transport system ATP-binding protein
MIRLNDITLAFGSRKLIEHASAHFECGRMTALLGRNGTGKSTLLRAIASLGEVQGGAIEIGGRELSELSNADLARMVAFVNTERVSVEAMTAYDLVAVGRSPYTDWSGRLRSSDHEAIERSIRIAGVEHLADRYVDTLSDGECQRVMIAKALAQDTPAILLDEPTSYLDMPNRYELCTLLGRLAHDEGKCVLFSTHELDIALTLSDNIALVDTPQLLYMPTGEMIASGSIERLFDSPYIRFDASTRSIHLK